MKITLRDRLILLTVIPLLVVGSGLSLFYAWDRYTTVDKHIEDKASTLVDVLTMQTRLIIESGKLENLKPIYHYVLSRHNELIKNLAVVSNDNTVLYNATPTFVPEEHLLNSDYQNKNDTSFNNIRIYKTPGSYLYYVPIVKEGVGDNRLDFRYNSLGYVVFEVSKLPYQAQMRSAFALAFASLVLTVLLSMLYSQQIVRLIFKPLSALNQCLVKIRQGDTEAKVHQPFEDELETLRLGVNSLSQTLSDLQRDMEMNIEHSTQELRQNLLQFETQNVQLELAKRRAIEANQVKSEFLANMSHELRTPLNGVIGFTRQLYKTELNASQKDFLQTIETSANNLLSIINDILDFSKLDSGKMILEAVPFNFRDVIDESVSLLSESANNKGLEFSINIHPQLPNSLIGDALRIKQVLINLINNAIKFTEQGHVAVVIDYQLLEDSQIAITVDIEDTGIGISEAQAKTLFEAFNQADNNITRMYGGTGLGLVIAQRLADKMGGEITFESKIREGSTFRFKFVSGINQLPVDAIIEPLELAQKRILFFESKASTREAICRQLSFWQMQITTCSDQLELYQALTQQAFDYVVLGVQVTPANISAIKQLITSTAGAIHDVPLIVAMNSSSLPLKEAFIDAGATHVFSKPVTYKKLRRALQHTPEPTSIASRLKLPQTNDVKAMKVLAVDDNEANLKLLTSLLHNKVSEIDTADNGRKAVTYCSDHKYDLILMDIKMPVMDGSQAMQKIRANTINTQTPIIAVTAHALAGEKEQFIAAGFDGYLAKPIDDNLLDKLLCKYEQPTVSSTPAVADNSLINLGIDFDLSLSIKRSGNNQQLAVEMLTMLIDSLEPTVSELKHYIEINDVNSLASVIHKLNGACCYVGLSRLEQLVNELETQIKLTASIKQVEPELFELFDLVDTILDHKHLLLATASRQALTQ
ncbi:two-component sensor histidine kinase BarA [Thalassotalea ponticola]|uniref:two-component sensor histidine kinase BarA n=1 Tax=Thalassotalea ponticola TaxID=1523392 RepID=UPI0025B43FD0|nr:two-component sensor histidine kinase BarA [Thalassotalea ponticola]MDN3652123.1 two-component sensor histidine kinase BarA [Thalassotalea ponticola]